MKKSWQTSLGGFVTGISLIVGEVLDLMNVDAGALTNGEFNIALFMAGLGALGLGFAARDSKVTSEQSGAK